MAWGKKLSPAAKAFLFQTAIDFRISSPDWLPACIAFETMETFSTSVMPKRKDGSLISSAVGLIQFMRATIEELNAEYGASLTKADYAAMTVEKQLEWVWKYYKMVMRRLKIRSLDTIEDVYMVIHWPAAVGKPLTQTMYARGSSAYLANRGLDLDHNGIITKAEAGKLVRDKLARGMQPQFYG